MARNKTTFKCTIMNPDALIYENEVQSVFLTGDEGEYELMPYHYPVLGILKGNIIIDWKESVAIKSGVVRFFANDCIILVEQHDQPVKKSKKDSDDDIVFSDEKKE